MTDKINTEIKTSNINSKEVEAKQPTSEDIEKALIEVIKAGLFYRKPKDGNFLKNYKKRIINLRQAEEPEEHIIENAKNLFPNKEKYYYMKNQYEN
jgi:hypothetical protein